MSLKPLAVATEMPVAASTLVCGGSVPTGTGGSLTAGTVTVTRAVDVPPCPSLIV